MWHGQGGKGGGIKEGISFYTLLVARRSSCFAQSQSQAALSLSDFFCLKPLDLMYLLIVFLPLLGSSVAGFFGRFLGSEGTAVMTTTQNLILFSIFIFFLIFLFRIYSCFSRSGFLFKQLLYLFLLVLFSVFFYFFRIYLASHFFTYLTGALLISCVSSGAVTSYPGPSDPSSSSSWKEDSFGIRVLLESWSKTTETEGTSVNQSEAGPVPPGNPVASPGEEAGPANQTLRVGPYPYQPDEVIGGDCVLSIERRLLAEDSFPSSEVIRMARIQAEDLFEVKVEIIKLMAGLDPTGDWMGRGARALENSRTATGEESLERLYALLEDLQRGGVQSSTYFKLKEKVFLRMDPDEHSSA